MQLPRIGQLFEQRYEIRAVLGAGGFAQVYLATDISVGRAVVIKVLAPSEGGYGGPLRARFLREASVFAGLHDPHTITMFDHGESSDGLLFMVFEHVAGRDLSALLASQGRLPPKVVGHILEQLLSALREAHDLGVLHRDIKPANVLAYEYAGDPFRVKLIDFGIAKDTRADVKLTRTGHVVGTVRYMSPEQLLGGQVGPASDLYSLGLVAYELLTGRPAIAGDSQKELLKQQISDAPFVVPPLLAPGALRAAIEHLLAREPDARPQSAAAALPRGAGVAGRDGKLDADRAGVAASGPTTRGADRTTGRPLAGGRSCEARSREARPSGASIRGRAVRRGTKALARCPPGGRGGQRRGHRRVRVAFGPRPACGRDAPRRAFAPDGVAEVRGARTAGATDGDRRPRSRRRARCPYTRGLRAGAVPRVRLAPRFW